MTSVLRFLGFGLLALFLLALPSAQAQGPTPQATLGSAFTYRGFLADGVALTNGTYDFHFSPFDAAGGGTQVGATLTLNDVTVTDGRFTVQLDFGNVFTGSALWLQVSVRPGASTGSYTTLSPRQALTPAPYALYALKIPLAGSGSAATAAHSDHDHFGQIWSGSAAQGLRVDNASTTGVGLFGSAPTTGTVGIATATSGTTYGVYGRSDSPSGAGVYGYATGFYGRGVYGVAPRTGVYGQSTDTSGVGVHGSSSYIGVSGSAGATSGTTYGVYGMANSPTSIGVYGYIKIGGTVNYAVYGRVDGAPGTGVYGRAPTTGTVGIATATTGTTIGVYGKSDSSDGRGVVGYAPRYGVYGSASNTGVYGVASIGVYGRSYSYSGYGVYGYAPRYGVYGRSYDVYGPSYGVYGSARTYGVYGTAYSTGVYGIASFYGVYGESPNGTGVIGWATAISGTTFGVVGRSNSTDGTGVYGSAPTTGTVGIATATTGTTYGVYGRSDSPYGRGVYGTAPYYGVYGYTTSTYGRGVYGVASATSGTTYGVYGWSRSTSGRGVLGVAVATSGTTYGVYGASNSPSGRGVYGTAPNYGVYGYATSTYGQGVYGRATGTSGRGVYGVASATSGFTYGVYGVSESPSGYAVYGVNYGGGYAGYFSGDVHVSGNFSASGTKSFKIDHPLDPANRYLLHFAQEAPQVQNVYNGVVTLDAQGRARVELPPYFSALNTGPFRYQLTPIGASMPELYIAQKIQNNAFLIAGGVPGMEVSWEVTAVRNDPYLRDHPVQDQPLKPAHERGTYLYPEGYGQPASKGLDALTQPPETPTLETNGR